MPEGGKAQVDDDWDASTWLALFVLGVLLFAGGVYFGLGVGGLLQTALPQGGWSDAVPFVLTIGGGVLGSYAYEEWYQHSGGSSGKGRRVRTLKDIPSFEIIRPGGGKGP
ncbi:MAG: hypothetical protein ACYDFT_00465 [Thermoplasmata archaeon]